MSILAQYKNSVVEINVDTGYDENTGEPIRVKHLIPAFLKIDKHPQSYGLGGVDQYIASYRGYLLNDYPPGASSVQDVRVAFNHGGSSNYTLVREIISPFFNQLEVLGTPITLLNKV